MDDIINNKTIIKGCKTKRYSSQVTNLSKAEVDRQYIIKCVETTDGEMKDFLLTLGCYEGETITLISILGENYIINIKDARYSIDKELAEAIKI
jgi:Fe2+ transport system protein FeoA